MTNEPLVLEKLYHTGSNKVWSALTNNSVLQHWYFSLDEFKAEIGFQFSFLAGENEIKYMHLCEVTEVVSGKKITYSWQYKGYPGLSYVSFELFEQDKDTLVRLTHTGLESFISAGAPFALEKFRGGWTYFLTIALKGYLEPAK